MNAASPISGAQRLANIRTKARLVNAANLRAYMTGALDILPCARDVEHDMIAAEFDRLAAALKTSEDEKTDWARRWKLGDRNHFGSPWQWMTMALAAQAALARARTLLTATADFVTKSNASPIVESITEMTVRYDDADCDGLCLRDDIRHWRSGELTTFDNASAALAVKAPETSTAQEPGNVA